MALRPRDRDQIQALHGKINAKYMPKAKTRMAGEEMPAELEPLLREIREEGAEELRQEAIVQAMHPEVSVQGLINGSSKTAEQQVARGLLYEGVMPDVLPADRYAVEDLADRTQLGIAGPFQSDSQVLQGTTGGLVTRMTEDGPEQMLEVYHTPNRTEILSKETEKSLYREWERSDAGQKALDQIYRQVNNPRMRHVTERNVPGLMAEQFNAAVGEYYGQQALKAVGVRPVADNQRSHRVREGLRGPAAAKLAGSDMVSAADSTLGTDRLVENSVGLLHDDIDFSGDYRYVRDNEVKVGDYQTGNPEDTIRLNLLKQVRVDKGQRDNFEGNYSALQGRYKSAGVNPTPEKVIKGMIAQGQLPEIQVGSTYDKGVRGGKALSGTALFEPYNRDRQYRYDEILFGHTDPTRRRRPGGYMPEDLILVDTAKANEAVGQMDVTPYMAGEVNVTPKINDLVAAEAAIRLTDDPRVKQLFGQR